MRWKNKGYILILLGLLALFFSMYWTLFEAGLSLKNLKIQYSYYTNQVTVISGIYLILLGFYCCGVNRLGILVCHPTVKKVITACVLIVCIGYYVGVVPFSLFSAEELYLLEPQSIYMHAINPIIVLYLYRTTPSYYNSKRGIHITAQLCSITYFLWFSFTALSKARFTSFYVYPFLNPQVMGSKGNALLTSLMVLSIGIIFILIFTKSAGTGGQRDSS